MRTPHRGLAGDQHKDTTTGRSRGSHANRRLSYYGRPSLLVRLTLAGKANYLSTHVYQYQTPRRGVSLRVTTCTGRGVLEPRCQRRRSPTLVTSPPCTDTIIGAPLSNNADVAPGRPAHTWVYASQEDGPAITLSTETLTHMTDIDTKFVWWRLAILN